MLLIKAFFFFLLRVLNSYQHITGPSLTLVLCKLFSPLRNASILIVSFFSRKLRFLPHLKLTRPDFIITCNVLVNISIQTTHIYGSQAEHFFINFLGLLEQCHKVEWFKTTTTTKKHVFLPHRAACQQLFDWTPLGHRQVGSLYLALGPQV